MRFFKTYFPILTVIAATVTWLALSEPTARLALKWLQPWRAQGPQVGQVMELEGAMKSVRDGRVEEIEGPLSAPLPVYSGDRLEIDARSRATLVLNSQDELQLESLSAAALQLWNERDPTSAVYLTLLSGAVESRKAGAKGKAYIVREGRLYLPGQKATGRPMALTVLKSAPLDMEFPEEVTASEATAADFDPESALVGNDSTAKDFGAEPETLSNEYIDDSIASKQALLQKCWLARLKDHPDTQAQLMMQFEISRKGKVKEVKVADSSVDDDTLKNCVSQVFERLAFRTFKGSEISLSYPIRFE